MKTVPDTLEHSSVEKTQHTPGPWYLAENDYTGCLKTVYSQEDIICEYVGNRADAHLIAAAPDLLAALENLIARDLICDIEGDHYAECMEAIAKAKEVQP